MGFRARLRPGGRQAGIRSVPLTVVWAEALAGLRWPHRVVLALGVGALAVHLQFLWWGWVETALTRLAGHPGAWFTHAQAEVWPPWALWALGLFARASPSATP